jgi:hypothetical protein
MPLIFGQNHPGDDTAATLRRLETLRRDLQALAEGKPPAPKTLRAAPLLEQFRIAGREALCLVGTGAGHPHLPAGPIATAEVWAFAADFSWARTFSGFYRLGTPHPGEPILAPGH